MTGKVRLQLGAKTRDLAMFNLAIDSKLRACDLTKLRVGDVCLGEAGDMGAGVFAADHMIGDQPAHPVHLDYLYVA